jgi:hypothetical protein
MAVPTTLELLRLYINDPEPTDGSQPQFSNDQLQSALDGAAGNPERAAAEVWRWKAAAAASMVDVTEGNASRAMSDLQPQAMAMVKHFESSRSGATEGRTTLGRIRRRYR